MSGHSWHWRSRTTSSTTLRSVYLSSTLTTLSTWWLPWAWWWWTWFECSHLTFKSDIYFVRRFILSHLHMFTLSCFLTFTLFCFHTFILSYWSQEVQLSCMCKYLIPFLVWPWMYFHSNCVTRSNNMFLPTAFWDSFCFMVFMVKCFSTKYVIYNLFCYIFEIQIFKKLEVRLLATGLLLCTFEGACMPL